jgi:hypothetical protein
MQQSQSTPGVTIVNGAPAQGDHSRKPSVTITSAGTSGNFPNGGANSRPNSLQFGFANQQTSPNLGNPAVLANQPQSGLAVSPNMNPRVTSPQTSPSPIPQPASSGGRPPPSSYQSQGNVPNFGSFGEAGDNVSTSTRTLYSPVAPFLLPIFPSLPFLSLIRQTKKRRNRGECPSIIPPSWHTRENLPKLIITFFFSYGRCVLRPRPPLVLVLRPPISVENPLSRHTAT